MLCHLGLLAVLAALLALEDARELASDDARGLAFELALLPVTDPRGDMPVGQGVINRAPVIMRYCSPAPGVGDPLVARTVASNSMDLVASGVDDAANPLEDPPLQKCWVSIERRR